jgi:hypothetical protein
MGRWNLIVCSILSIGLPKTPNQALQQTAGHDRFLGVNGSACPAAAELGRSKARQRTVSNSPDAMACLMALGVTDPVPALKTPVVQYKLEQSRYREKASTLPPQQTERWKLRPIRWHFEAALSSSSHSSLTYGKPLAAR